MVLVVAVVLGITLGARVLTGGGLSAPVVAGDAYVSPERPADLAVVHENSTGYDGQFVYRLALDPFTREATADGITLDNPPYRQQRLLLPLAAHALHRLGVPVSLGLLLVNALGVLLAAWAGAVLAHRLGRHRAWGALLALSPAVVIAANRDLTEPLQIGLLLAGLVAWTGERTRRTLAVAVLLFTAAAFTRETTLAVLFGLGLWELSRTAFARAAALLVPVAAIAAWQVHLRNVWGALPSGATDDSLGLPFVRTARTFLAGGGDWSVWTTAEALQQHAWVVERVLLAALLVCTAAVLRRSAVDNGIKAAWVVATLLAASTQWTRDVAFLRAANEAIVLATLVLLATRTKAASGALAGTAGLSVFVGGVYALAL